jgi:GNAT superfamily N-acetyltransferase
MDFRAYQEGDAEAIVALYQRAFSRPFSFQPWRWRFVDNPAGKGVVELAWDGKVLAGHYAVTASVMEIEGQKVLSGLSGTTMTDPDYRGLGLFPTLARRCYARMEQEGHVMAWGFPNANSHRGFVRDLGWSDVYEIPTMRLAIAAARPPPVEARVDEVANFDTRFDDLWRRARGGQAIIGVRDRKHLEWRYRQNPGERYRVLASCDGEVLRGYAVCKRYQDEIQIVDMLIEGDGPWLLDLMSRAIQMARETSCESVGLWCGPHNSAHEALEKLAFRNGEPVTYLGVRGFSSGVSRLASDYRNWFLQMGDSDVY